MYKMPIAKLLGAAMIVAAGTCAAIAQTAGPTPRGSTVTPVPPEVVKELAPTGKLRAALNLGNGVLVQGSPQDPRGVTVDLSRELARRIGVPLEFVTYEAAGKVFEALKTGAWDVAFFAIEPVRAADVDFTAPYVPVSYTHLTLPTKRIV